MIVGSRFASPNKAVPIWLTSAAQPACMDAAQWAVYLAGVRAEAMADPGLRKRLERGGAVDHCCGCTSANRTAMRAASRCFPSKEAASAVGSD